MRIQSLFLVNFRNYATLDATFSAGKNVFLGNNGQGKTNLLEALYFLSHTRSHRAGGDRELVRTGEGFSTISAGLRYHAYDGETMLEARIRLDGERLKTVFRRDAQPIRSRSEVLGHLPTVSFFLPDLLLLRGAPEDRRRWLDAAIVQYDKRHLNALSDFQKVRQQKNRLLKSEPDQVSREHLATWNLQLASTGARVTASRLAYLSRILAPAARTYQTLGGEREVLGMQYQSGVLDELGVSLSNADAVAEAVENPAILETTLLRQTEQRMSEEIRRGTSLVGPHRDDLRFDLDGMPADAYGSQGQQRSIVLALKLTELQCLSAHLREPPVLLLDDVMAELDPERQRLLVSGIPPESQVFITTTHPGGSWRALLERDPFREVAEVPEKETMIFTVCQGKIHSDPPLPEWMAQNPEPSASTVLEAV